ncbi:MAG: guanylate kinase [Actinomycetaceae bacterium]|nr:guanylate kinase [Actinomycetaceae bacterium]
MCQTPIPIDTQSHSLTVISGPTAVGKGTVVRELIKRHPQVYLSISGTTRSPRPGEEDGVHYHFLSDEEFSQRIQAGDFLEWARVHGQHRYGTLVQPIREVLAAGRPALLEIDLDGARQVKKTMPEAQFIFLAPPSWDELVNRLEGRGTESADEMTRRLATAREELAAQEEFDVVIVNDEVNRTVEELASVMHLT